MYHGIAQNSPCPANNTVLCVPKPKEMQRKIPLAAPGTLHLLITFSGDGRLWSFQLQ